MLDFVIAPMETPCGKIAESLPPIDASLNSPTSAIMIGQKRTWSDSTRTFSGVATFNGLIAGKLVLLNNEAGQGLQIPLDWFSSEDREYVLRGLAAGDRGSDSSEAAFTALKTTGQPVPAMSRASTSSSHTADIGAACPWQRFIAHCDVLCDTSHKHHPRNLAGGEDGELLLSNGRHIRTFQGIAVTRTNP